MSMPNPIRKRLYAIICLLPLAAGVGAPADAMSRPPSQGWTPPDWRHSASAEDDARAALAHGDHRLLGFARRGYNIPGIEAGEQAALIERCGIRTFANMGDVVRSAEHLQAMQKASAYARRYNAIILRQCAPERARAKAP